MTLYDYETIIYQKQAFVKDTPPTFLSGKAGMSEKPHLVKIFWLLSFFKRKVT